MEVQQDRPEEDTRWNSSSIKHRSKMEELSKDRSSKEKFGNINFSRNDNYIISSGGSCTVYLGFSEEHIEVAIKEIETDTIDNQEFEKELKSLQDLNLESKNIVKYVGLEKYETKFYLAVQLCECDLKGYMENSFEHLEKTKVVKEVLRGLQVLHSAGVIHSDLKPSNIVIDSFNTAKLADYGISCKPKKDSSTVGEQIWEATEILNKTEEYHTKSSDIQVAGMLVYYILSDGKHPFGENEQNIKEGFYTLDDITDSKTDNKEVAKDLIKWMINKDPTNRPTIDEVLRHPYFYDDDRKDVVLRRLGDKKEVQKYADSVLNKKLLDAVQKYTNTNTSNWRSKMHMWRDIDKNLPDNLLGLLRFLRNQLVHKETEFIKSNMYEIFPDFFISVHWLAKDMEWKY